MLYFKLLIQWLKLEFHKHFLVTEIVSEQKQPQMNASTANIPKTPVNLPTSRSLLFTEGIRNTKAHSLQSMFFLTSTVLSTEGNMQPTYGGGL
jgi:hypothetical protein